MPKADKADLIEQMLSAKRLIADHELLDGDDCYPSLTCPECSADCGEDLDGFGFVFCEHCRHCSHLSRLGTVCEICGHDEASDGGTSKSCTTVADKKDDPSSGSAAGRQEPPAWQPIETAPKGELVLVALIRDGVVWRVSDARHSGLGWYTKNGEACHWRTHWAPMPAGAAVLGTPPQEKDGATQDDLAREPDAVRRAAAGE